MSSLLIIGGGPAGYKIAAEAANAGWQVTLIERDHLGGTCLNRGCIPTKCLCASAQTLLTVQDAAKYGIDVETFKADYGKAVQRVDSVVEQLREGIDQLLRDVTVVRGEAALCPLPEPDSRIAQCAVRVGDRIYTAENIFIATGSQPASLPIPGAALAVSSDEVLKWSQLPQRVAIVGGGVIGMEFASIMAAYGVEVTVIEYCKEILPPFDKDVAKRLRTALSRRGVKTIVGAAVTSISQGSVTYQGKKGPATLECDAVVMAVGRKPVIPEGAHDAGLALAPRGAIAVDDLMRTNIPGVWAIGDCNGRCMLAHAAEAQARVAMGHHVDLDIMPSAVFTIPECAMVGPTEEQLQSDNTDYGTARAMFAANGKAVAMGEAEGFVKVLYDKSDGRLLACHVIGPHAADIVAEATTAIALRATIRDLACRIIHAHPTLSETLMAACEAAR